MTSGDYKICSVICYSSSLPLATMASFKESLTIGSLTTDKQEVPISNPPRYNVLLIGSTGMGKSTFGNFLLDPNERHMLHKQTFPMATDNKPMTQQVRTVPKQVSTGDRNRPKCELTVIDTPGLNENVTKDLAHMIQLIKGLRDINDIHACVLVVKFNAKIDAQYQATLDYYCTLLPELFERNVIIVMTDFATDERSVKMRQRQGINVERVKQNTLEAITSNESIGYSPAIFSVDCLPLDKEEEERSLETRTDFFQFIFTMTPITLTEFKVAKMASVKLDDAQRISKLEGEINGYSERLQQVNQKGKLALKDAQKKESIYTQTQNEVKRLEADLKEKDKDFEVIAKSWSCDIGWKFGSIEEKFSVNTHLVPTTVKKWTNGRFTVFNKTEKGAEGEVQGKFMRGLTATVEVYTEKRHKYAEEIIKLKANIHNAYDQLRKSKQDCDKLNETHKEHDKEIDLLKQYIKDKRGEISYYSSNYMTIEEANIRLRDIRQQQKKL